MKHLVILSMGLFLLVGCGEADITKGNNTVQHYDQNIDEAKTTVQACKDKVKSAAEYQKIIEKGNCRNAHIAVNKAEIQRVKDKISTKGKGHISFRPADVK